MAEFKISNSVYLAAIGIWALYNYSDKINIPIPNNKPSVVVVDSKRVVSEPAPDLKAIVAPITTALSVKIQGRDQIADCYLVGDFCGDFADIITKNGLLKTNKSVRQVYTDAGKLVFDKGQLSTLYPSLPIALDSAIAQVLTLESGQSDVNKQYQLFKAIQWAAYQAVK